MALCVLPRPLGYQLYIRRRRISEQNARKSNFSCVRMTAGGRVVSYEEGELERPNWSGETPLSRLVGALISFKPFFSLLKLGARQVIIRLYFLILLLTVNLLLYYYNYYYNTTVRPRKVIYHGGI